MILFNAVKSIDISSRSHTVTGIFALAKAWARTWNSAYPNAYFCIWEFSWLKNFNGDAQ
jgi:hypothetical protein